jgi:ApaG protein
MVTAITDGIKVSVESIFQSEYSNPASEHFMFAYRIEIINQSDFPVKLLRRKWIIFDSNNTKREVEGEGVVGLQPIIQPGETHVYVSGSNLKTEMGSMRGNYLMQRLNDSTLFYVDIPVFQLVADYKLN